MRPLHNIFPGVPQGVRPGHTLPGYIPPPHPDPIGTITVGGTPPTSTVVGTTHPTPFVLPTAATNTPPGTGATAGTTAAGTGATLLPTNTNNPPPLIVSGSGGLPPKLDEDDIPPTKPPGGGGTTPVQAGGSPTQGGGPGQVGGVDGGGPTGPRNMGTNLRNPRAPLSFNVGGARFSFPSIHHSSRSSAAPAIHWGAGWREVRARNGKTYMLHTNGARAVLGDQNRVGVSNPSKVSVVATPFGRGKRFPDGTVVVPGIGHDRQPYRIAPDGRVYPLSFGKHKFGGVTARVFHASTVHVTTPDGRSIHYDSRGNVRLPRGHRGHAANGNIHVNGGGPMNITASQLTSMVNQVSQLTSQVLERAEASGQANPEMTAQIRALIAQLPEALQGALNGALGQAINGGGGNTLVNNPGSSAPKPFVPTTLSSLYSQGNPTPPRSPRPGERLTDFIESVLMPLMPSRPATPVQPAQPTSPTNGGGGSGGSTTRPPAHVPMVYPLNPGHGSQPTHPPATGGGNHHAGMAM